MEMLVSPLANLGLELKFKNNIVHSYSYNRYTPTFLDAFNYQCSIGHAYAVIYDKTVLFTTKSKLSLSVEESLILHTSDAVL